MEVLSLNLIPTGTTPVVHVKQYDVGRTWRFELKEGPLVYTLDGTETIECDIKKKDGNVVTVAVTNTSASYIDIETTLQMTACSGDNLGAIRLKKGSDDIGTLNFILACERSPLENGIESESSIHNLEQQIADAVADQYDADSVIFDNTPTADHGVGFAVTSEGLLSYIPKTAAALDDVTITTPTDGEILVYNNGSWENQANPASTQNFAPDYDDTATYNTNDKVIYQGLLYVCLEDSVTGAWDSTKWQNISVADYNATLLPITSGSATNTKDYIDAVSGSIPTLNVAESSSVVGVNGTWQIPANVLAHTLVIVSVRRQGLGNSAIFTKDDLLARDNGFMLASSPTVYCTLKCSNTGLLTVTNLTNMNDVFVRTSGLF